MVDVVVIGCGGIWTQIMFPVSQYLDKKFKEDLQLYLVDGDEFETKNKERQIFTDEINKAEACCLTLESYVETLNVTPIAEFLTPNNVEDIIKEDSIVIVCVDNHKTRHLIEKHSLTLNNCFIISGGNELTDGNAMAYQRCNGKTIGQTFTELHSEIGEGKDKSPHEMSCQELAASSTPQIVITNAFVGGTMMNILYNALENGQFTNEVFCDIVVNKVVPRTVFKMEKKQEAKRK